MEKFAEHRYLYRCGMGVIAAFITAPAFAGVCGKAWNGDEFASKFAKAPAHHVVRLRDKSQAVVAEVNVSQVMAFYEAKDKIAWRASINPRFVVCGDAEPNAFAMPTAQGPIVGVTVGMLKLVDGDRDQAAYIIAHEVAHHSKKHIESTQTTNAVVGLLAAIIGVAIEVKNPNSRVPGAAIDLANIGGKLVNAKFSRDQEREADDVALTLMGEAGFNPMGAIRAAEKIGGRGSGGVGLFFDSHPGWDERAGRIQTLIAQSPSLSRLAGVGNVQNSVASSSPTTVASSTSPKTTQVEHSEKTSDASFQVPQAPPLVLVHEPPPVPSSTATTLAPSPTGSVAAASVQAIVPTPVTAQASLSKLPPCPGTYTSTTWSKCFGTWNPGSAGETYVGEFMYGTYSGYGTQYRSDGSLRRSGRWRNGEFVGSDPAVAVQIPLDSTSVQAVETPTARRLRELNQLLKESLITDSEYQEMRKSILADL